MSDAPTPLEFLTAVYCNESLPIGTRMRAAIEAAQYRHPKLGAVATTNMDGRDFAALLERAIARSGVRLIEAKAVEPPQPE